MNNIKKSLKFSNGITLIALVITIIVLLILAGVSISMLSGDNGILQKATTAKENSDKSQIEEKIKLAYHAALTDGHGSYTKESLEKELKNEFGENNYNVDDSDDTNWILTSQGQNVQIPAGNSANKIIKFYLGSEEYEVEEGTTWEQWLESHELPKADSPVAGFSNSQLVGCWLIRTL